MASLFTHSRLKLWIWIVIIAAGSIIVLSLLAFVWWCCAKRTQAKKESLPSPVLAPTRKVTVRRGRMVSSSRYLSLTGSKFGLGQFMNLEEKDQAEKSRSRSRSPFMWWLSTAQERPQSKQSHMSGQPQMDEAHSQDYQRPEPTFYNRHAREESAASGYSLPSIINGKELAEDARVNAKPLGASSGSPHSSRYINFSRALSPLHQSALRSTSAPNVLSQIVESSPRQSTLSKHPSVISTREAVSKHPSMIGAKEVVEGDVSALMPHPAPALRPLQTSRSVPDNLLRRSSGRNMTSRFSFTAETSLSLSAGDPSRTHSVPNISHLPASPRSGPLPRGREYLEESTSTSNPAQSVAEKQPSSEMNKLDHQTAGSTQDGSSHGQSMAYWGSRPDLQPVRKPSKKGNVLRKKSIRRAEIVSWVGN
jgi:hypothetical protein